MTFQTMDEVSTDQLDPSTLPIVVSGQQVQFSEGYLRYLYIKTSWAACLDNQGTLESNLGSVFLRVSGFLLLACAQQSGPESER